MVFKNNFNQFIFSYNQTNEYKNILDKFLNLIYQKINTITYINILNPINFKFLSKNNEPITKFLLLIKLFDVKNYKNVFYIDETI